jgi:uncharacterized protein (TIGR02453 family)
MAGFAGFPREATDFFTQLEANNNRDWFRAHTDVYERACREPMKALLAELDPGFGGKWISRINRDMRFSRDGGPYKNYIAAGVKKNYISLSSQGLYVGTGMYKPEPAMLQRFRAAIDDETTGRTLAKLVSALRRKGYQVDTHASLSSAPRGFAADHPRIDFLRMKDIFAGKLFPPGPTLGSRKLFAGITKVIDEIQPLGDWLRRYVV